MRTLSATASKKQNSTFFLFRDRSKWSQWTKEHILACKDAKTLYWSGPIDTTGLFEVLDRVIHLETLHLESCCGSAKKNLESTEEFTKKTLSLRHLRQLTFVNFTDSIEVLQMFSTNVLTSRLEEFHLYDTEIAGGES